MRASRSAQRLGSLRSDRSRPVTPEVAELANEDAIEQCMRLRAVPRAVLKSQKGRNCSVVRSQVRPLEHDTGIEAGNPLFLAGLFAG